MVYCTLPLTPSSNGHTAPWAPACASQLANCISWLPTFPTQSVLFSVGVKLKCIVTKKISTLIVIYVPCIEEGTIKHVYNKVPGMGDFTSL